MKENEIAQAIVRFGGEILKGNIERLVNNLEESNL